MNAQRRRENTLLKREGWMIHTGNPDYVINGSLRTWIPRQSALRIIVSQAATALAAAPKLP